MMAYNKFTYKTVEKKLNLSLIYEPNCFMAAVPKIPSEKLTETLKPSPSFPLHTEQARREWIIINVFRAWIELTNGNISIYSAEIFDVEPAMGLTGEADYLISLQKGKVNLTAPVIAVAEAKNDRLTTGIGQCIAEMYAVRLYNERENHPVKRIFGIVTTGLLWGFMVLEGNEVKMDPREYTLSDLDEILGILVYMSKNAV